MAVKIGHASIDENGKVSGGAAGDQTKTEVCIRTWYSKPWGFVLRCKDSSKAEKMAVACEQGCANEKIGYDQVQRNTLYTQAKSVNYDLSKITTACECDCSSFITVCALAAGIKITYGTNAPTTSTMKTVFRATGEFDLLTDSKYLSSDSYLKRGDILVKAGSHTAMALENGSTTIKCVDVSSYQGDIDWNLVKSAGVDHVILKVIRKDLNPDTKFEQNWKNCQSANINAAGVYNYSYATTTAKAKADAQKVLSILNGRKTVVWLDVEDTCQQGIGTLLKDIINTYRDVIVNAGYDFGVYTGMSFYNSYLKPYISQIKCDKWWIARYYNGYNQMAVSTNPNEQYNPKTSIGQNDIYGWQYTSSGIVNGISGNVDLSVIYGKIQSSTTTTATNDKGYISGAHVFAAKGKVFNCTKLNMRKEPVVEANNVVSVLNVNDEVYLMQIADNGWYKVQTKDNLVGYVSNKYITIL